jgi:SAM-dependent methyltransferase
VVSRDLPTYLEQETLLDALQKASQEVHGGLLLDIGCGDKPYVHLFPRVTRYVGIDLPPSSDTTRRPDVWASGLHLPFANQSFQTVFCAQVLEHVPRPEELLAEAFRVLKGEGRIILTAPQTWGLHEEPHDYYRFTRYGLQYLLESCGFVVQLVEARGGAFRMMGQTFLNTYYLRKQIPRLTPGLRTFNRAWNSLFACLDRRWPWEKDTLGYIACAIRPLGAEGRGGE